ncbi:MAG: FlgD immunoglobulin-like domain containing protein, partial [Candidatus Poribacteria bacterium]|nr:FlgD immunoglobulin-like domain containing protein [Candidatus Poribacteria bacterium]
DSSEFNVPRLIISSNAPGNGTTIILINLEVGQLSIPTETNLMVVEGYVEKTSAQVYENLSVGIWIERGIEVDADDDGLEDSWEEYHFNNDLTFTDGSQDSDGDDQDNWAEFHGRSDPNDASSLPRYFEDVPVNNDGSYRMLLANLPTGPEPVLELTSIWDSNSPVVAAGDTIFVYLDDQADKGSDEESYRITSTDIQDNFIQIDLEAVMTISKSIPIKGFDDPVVLTITDQIVGLKQPPRIQQVRTAEQERMVTKLQIGIQQGQPARQIETVLKIEVPGTTNTGIGGIFHETPLGIEIPFDTNKAEPVDVIALISIDSVNRSETVEILETEIIGNKLRAQLAHLSYVVTMKNTAPVFHASQANESLEAIGATEDIQLSARMLAATAGSDSQLLNLDGMFSDSDSEIGDQMTYEATSDNPELLNVAVVEGEVMQLMLETTDDKSQEGIAEISILVEDTNGATSQALIFYVDVASVLPDHWQDGIDLQLGLNLFSLPLQPINQIGELEQWTAADLADKIPATVIVSMDNGQFVPFIPQVMKNNDGSYLDQGFDLEGGKAYIINVMDDLTLTLNGQPWSNSPSSEGLAQPLRSTETNFDDSSVRRAPNRVLAPWTFVISGDLITDSALSFGFDLSQVSRIVAVDTRTGKELIGQLKGNRFHFVLADLTMQPVVMDGQSFDIRAEGVDGNLIAGPFNWQLNADHLQQAYIHQEMTIGDVIPSQTQLLPNYPNPFNPETWIPFELEQASNVQLIIFDSQGHIIRQLDLGHQIAGRYLSKSRAAYWDGYNKLGEQVSSGVYFYTFIAESEQSKWLPQTRKMVILK